jgi:hypothetical protein
MPVQHIFMFFNEAPAFVFLSYHVGLGPVLISGRNYLSVEILFLRSLSYSSFTGPVLNQGHSIIESHNN